jgi:hypothetical protein
MNTTDRMVIDTIVKVISRELSEPPPSDEAGFAVADDVSTSPWHRRSRTTRA